MFMGVAFAMAASFVYAIAVFRCPIIYVSFVLPIGFGISIGLVVTRTAKRLKLHQAAVLRAIGLTAGTIGLYMAWVNWLTLLVGDEAARRPLMTHPAAIGRAMLLLYQTGTWSVGPAELVITGMAERFNGPLLGLIWLGEAGAIVVLATVFSLRDGRGDTYCNSCQTYYSNMRWLHSYRDGVDTRQIRRLLESHDWPSLAKLPFGDYGNAEKLELCVQSCDQCGERHVLSLRRSVAVAKSGKKPTKKFEVLIDRLVIETADLEAIKQYPPIDPSQPVEADM